MDPLLIAAGLIVGVLVGLTGVGGGSLMTPTLIFGFGVPAPVAVGTDLVFAAITKSGATLAHARRATVEWRTVARLAAGSLPAAALMLYWLDALRAAHIDIAAIITPLLGIALIATATALLFKQQLLRATQRGQVLRYPAVATITTGAVLGIFVSLTSVGAGALGVAALLLLYPHLAARRIVGSDIAHATLLAAVAGAGHWHGGTVDVALLLPLLAGSLPGIWLGTRLCTHCPEHLAQRILAAALFVAGARFVL